MLLTRRSFFKGLGLLVAAPAIVKAENLMKIKSIEEQEAEIKEILAVTSSHSSSLYWVGGGNWAETPSYRVLNAA